MERPPHLRPRAEEYKKEEAILAGIVVLFHTVGLIGLAMPAFRPLFLRIVPWHILLMLAVIMIAHKPFNERFLLFTLTIFGMGFICEWIGVHYNWLFGHYSYGKTLGWQLSGIPLIIGANWFLLIYAAGVTMQNLRVRNIFTRIFAGALILVLLDMLIEPVAVKYDYWHWKDHVIPFKNYACWFFISALMLYVFEKSNLRKQNRVAVVLLIIQFVFFGLLHWF